MNLHGDEVLVGDRVYDISANRGFGTVTRVNADTFEVNYNGKYRLIYDSRGVQKNKSTTTLYWNVPVIIVPTKDDQHWNIKQQLVNDIYAFVERFKDIQ